MSKPLGISLSVSTIDGLPRMAVTPHDRVGDQIWNAVREAIDANMTPSQFKAEASEAWTHCLKQDAQHAREILR